MEDSASQFPHPARAAASEAVGGALADLLGLANEERAAVAVVSKTFADRYEDALRMLEEVTLIAGARSEIANLIERCAPPCACPLHERFSVLDKSLDDALALIEEDVVKWGAARDAEYGTLRALEAVKAKSARRAADD
jgi:hypothetical protein